MPWRILHDGLRLPRGATTPARGVCAALGAAALLCAAHPARGQEEVKPAPRVKSETPDANPYEGRLVKDVRFDGLKRVGEQYLRNQLRTAPGQPLVWETVREDLRRMERLGEFRDIQADVLVDDDLNVVVRFRVMEAPIIRGVSVTGNRQVTDDDIQQTVASVISLTAGIPIDDYQIGRAQRQIEELYRNKGYYLAQVTVDESELEEGGELIFHVREGERVKVTSIRFEGNDSFRAKEIRPDIKTRTAWLFNKGVIDDTLLDGDVAAVTKFYLDRGHLDVRVSRRITPSPNGREAIVTFLIEEGLQYTLRTVSVERGGRRQEGASPGLTEVVSPEQVRGLLELKAGDAFSASALDRSVKAVRDAYRKMGYVDARVDYLQLRVPEAPLVDLQLSITEGERFKTGMVYIQGNDLTQQKVVRREVEVKPDRWLDGFASDETERRLKQSRLFTPTGVKVTIQPEDPREPGSRDVLVEVEETNTGTLGFGAAVSSDAGLTGLVNLTQRNFDITDWPDSFDEFIRGRAFRGAGQTFNLSLQPGTESQNYTISIVEPYLFDTPHSLSSSLYYRSRQFDEYDESRIGTRWGLRRRFGTRWTGGIGLRAETIDLEGINQNAAVDLLEVEGQNTLIGFGPELSRSTVDNRFRPTIGTYTEFSVEQVAVDYNFTKMNAEHQIYFPIDEDFLGNKTVLSLKSKVGYIPQDDEAPVFERYYLGGRSFRGFDFRGIGPLGLRRDGTETNDHVGGEWSFFLGSEIERPVYKNVVSVVGFVDSGTVGDEIGFEDYRVSVGLGVRLYIEAFGNAPLAFDFGFPVVKQEGDDTQYFSFSIDLPFQ